MIDESRTKSVQSSVCFFGLFEKAPPLERHQSSRHKKRTSSLKKVFDHHHHHQKQQQQQHEDDDDDDDAIDFYDYGFGEARSCWCAFSFFSLFFLCRRREWIHTTRSGRDVYALSPFCGHSNRFIESLTARGVDTCRLLFFFVTIFFCRKIE